MSDHLPECPAGYVADLCTTDIDPVTQERSCNHCVGLGCICICDQLRACEQRVFQEQIIGRQNDMFLAYQRGVAKARRAVQVLPKGGMGQKAHALWRDALAAIDALREVGK